jgi:dTDP-4-dehydrorhamnose 3,5-epimerase-like enzyme
MSSKIQLIDFEIKGDSRGNLIALEEGFNVPFDVKRVYYIFGTEKNVVRGRHSHKNLKQLLICVSGSCVVDTEDSKKRTSSWRLDTPDQGLLIEGLVWREMRDFSKDAVLLVLADNLYCEKDYIRDYEEFQAHQANQFEFLEEHTF